MTSTTNDRPPLVRKIRGQRSVRTCRLGLIGLLGGASILGGTAAPALAAGPGPTMKDHSTACTPKEVKANGKTVEISCGPATAEVTYQGKQYSFKGGSCDETAGSITIQIGKELLNDNNGNGGYTGLDITLLSTKLGGEVQVNAFSGKMAISGQAKFGGTKLKGEMLAGVGGSFGASKGGEKVVHFSGTWNCGGTIYNLG